MGWTDAVDQIMHALDRGGLLENTYVAISPPTTALFRGEHRLAGGKYLPV